MHVRVLADNLFNVLLYKQTASHSYIVKCSKMLIETLRMSSSLAEKCLLIENKIFIDFLK